MLSGCSTWQKQSETENLMGGYRTFGSANALLGSYGLKLTSRKNQYQRIGVPGWGEVETRHVATVTISKTSKTGLERLSAAIPEIGDIQSDATWIKNGKYKITFLQIYDLSKLRAEINELLKDQARKDFVKDIKNPNIRFVTTAGIIFDHNWTKKFEGQLGGKINKLSLSSDLNLANLSVSIKGEHDETINISNNTVVAYQYVRPCWSEKGDEVLALVRDQVGGDSSACPSGTSHTHPDVI